MQKPIILFILFTPNLYAEPNVVEEVIVLDSGVSHVNRTYQNWTTTKIVDELEPRFQVITCTSFQDKSFPNEHSKFCLRFYSKNFIVIEPQSVGLAKGYWPHCDYDRITYKVDSNGPYTVPKIDSPGSCRNRLDTSDGTFINDFVSGESAKLKVHYSRGTISLIGFSDAYDYIVGEF